MIDYLGDMGTQRTNAVPADGNASVGWMHWKIPLRDVGIFPLILTCPIMYYPKVLEGDTQPWLLLSALVALFTFRTDRFVNRENFSLVVLSALCVAAYALRTDSAFGLARAAYTYIAFLVFWTVCERDGGSYMRVAVKLTVIVWFLVGVYQYVLVKLGVEIGMGRYVAGRSGVPSLTAEASFYGSISMLQMMFLLSERGRHNPIFIVCATISVVLSGSVLALLLLIFPLWRLPIRYRVGATITLAGLIAADFYFSSAGLVSRLISIGSGGIDITSAAVDPSLNLRAGNIYFTLIKNIGPSLMLQGKVAFMAQYNDFASQTGALMPVESDAILPALGEMIYGSGIIAVALLYVFLKKGLAHCKSKKSKAERLIFILACLLNPISLSNIFLIAYTQVSE